MNEKTRVTFDISSGLFDRLKNIAEPLIDSNDTVMEKLLNHWESSPPSKSDAKEMWRTSRGEGFPVGTRLRAEYDGELFEATVMKTGIFFSGETFSSPSAAAIHAKRMKGLRRSSANTNGWKFWEYWDDDTGTWLSIEHFRK